MTEKELRQKVVATAESYVGCKEADGSHRKIIDLYNSHKPLARGYAVKYTDAWCSTFASAVAIACGLTDIIPTECGCEKHIQLFKALGAWVENDAYVPKLGDYIFYDWQDGENYATTDNTGAADHVGIVTGISGNTITVTEGNMSDAVRHRKLKVNGRYIRGFGTPNYAAKAASMGAGGVTTPPSAEKPTGGTTGATGGLLSVGTEVDFVGNRHYTSSYATGKAKICKAGRAKITAVSPGNPHPYHCVAVSGKGSTVYGWVDSGDISPVSVKAIVKGGKVKVLKPVTYAGGSFKAYYDTYDVLQVDNDRVVIGIGKTVTAAVHKNNLQAV